MLQTTMYGPGYNQDTLDGGMQLGDTTFVYDFANSCFKELMLVQANEELSANAALKLVDDATVDMVDTAGDICAGVNDVSGFSPTVSLGTGAIVAADNYFFMTIRGGARPLLDAAVAAGPLATGSATPGQLVAWTDGGATFRQTNLQSLAASGAGGATNCFIY